MGAFFDYAFDSTVELFEERSGVTFPRFRETDSDFVENSFDDCVFENGHLQYRYAVL